MEFGIKIVFQSGQNLRGKVPKELRMLRSCVVYTIHGSCGTIIIPIAGIFFGGGGIFVDARR